VKVAENLYSLALKTTLLGQQMYGACKAFNLSEKCLTQHDKLLI